MGPVGVARDLAAAGVRAVAGPADLAQGSAAVRRVQVHPEVLGYVVDLARATRVSVAISATRKRLCWNLPIGLPNASRVLA